MKNLPQTPHRKRRGKFPPLDRRRLPYPGRRPLAPHRPRPQGGQGARPPAHPHLGAPSRARGLPHYGIRAGDGQGCRFVLCDAIIFCSFFFAIFFFVMQFFLFSLQLRHREIFTKSFKIKPKSDRRPFGSKSIGKCQKKQTNCFLGLGTDCKHCSCSVQLYCVLIYFYLSYHNKTIIIIS